MRQPLLMLAVLLSTTGAAQDEDCLGVIANSRVTSVSTADKSLIQQNADLFCSSYKEFRSAHEAQSADAAAELLSNLGYLFLSGNYAADSQSVSSIASKFCKTSENFLARADSYRSYLESIAPGAFDSYKECVAMKNAEIHIKAPILMRQPESLSFSVSFTPQNDTSSALLSLSSSPNVTCTWLGKDDKKPRDRTVALKKIASLDASCSRPDRNVQSWVQVTRSNGREAVSIAWDRFDADGNPVDAMAALQNRIAVLEGALTPSVIQVTSSVCPKGWHPYERGRGRFIRGVELSVGPGQKPVDKEGLREPGSLQDEMIKTHSHTINALSDAGTAGPGWGATWAAKSYGMDSSIIGSSSGLGEETRPKNVGLLFCERDK